jgi:hypothetical protein
MNKNNNLHRVIGGSSLGNASFTAEASEVLDYFGDGSSFISLHVYGPLAVLAEIRLRANDLRFKEFKNGQRLARRTVP